VLQTCNDKALVEYLHSKTDEFALIQLKHLFEDVALANTRGNDVAGAKAKLFNKGLETVHPAKSRMQRASYNSAMHGTFDKEAHMNVKSRSKLSAEYDTPDLPDED